MPLKLSREGEKDYVKVGESQVEIRYYRTVNKIMCSLEGDYASEESEKEAFQMCVS